MQQQDTSPTVLSVARYQTASRLKTARQDGNQISCFRHKKKQYQFYENECDTVCSFLSIAGMITLP